MCGIAGIASITDNAVTETALGRMVGAVEHRGPDCSGFYFSRAHHSRSKLKVGLGHSRLSIIDLDTGNQPMSSEDGTIWVTYNGEIYNFPEIKEDLIKKGYKFSTKSDTEVLIYLYREKGIRCLDDLRGMFAFCIWDTKNQRLFLARDRAGQKPLVYYNKNGLFLFASEIKSILEYGNVKKEIDLHALDKYMTYGYVPSPLTIYKDIKRLPPAHYIVYDGDKIDIARYWSLSYKEKTSLSFPEASERLYGLLGEATRMRLISDVPLGVFLSGGVDSSCVVALMSKFSSGKVKTFSIGFSDRDYDELKFARSISERFGTEHKEFVVKPKAMDILPKLAWHYDQPFADSSCIPTYYVAKMTREFVTVALSGDGGDESFAGYRRYGGIRLAEYFSMLPKGVLKAGCALSPPSGYSNRFFKGLIKNADLAGAYMDWLNYFDADARKELYSNEMKESLSGSRKEERAGSYLRRIIKHSDAAELTERMMNADVKSYLPEDLLVKVDIATMANSLEGRSPFLDHKVMEFAASLPLAYKLRGLNQKYVLKEAFKKDIPISFLNRKKRGFGVPVGKWFNSELKGFVDDMLLGKKAAGRIFFSRSGVARLLDEHRSKRRDHTHRLYALLSFEMWHRRFIDKSF